jgi:triacylglycerol esterase/lipase EstA (alpha/beta hydrolase family)
VLRHWRRWGIAAVAASLVVSVPSAFAEETVTAAPAPATGIYAALDRPGPALSIADAKLRAAVSCSKGFATAKKDPILLVPGTGLNPRSNFRWNYIRAFDRAGQPWCAVELPGNAMGDIQVAGEYVVHAIRHMNAVTGRKVDVLGFSQGGMVPRWALRFWPDTRSMVDDVVGLAPSNHGTVDAQACLAVCPAAFWQQRATSPFVKALNSGAETFAGIDYTVVYTRLDEVVMPNLDARTGSSSLRTGAGARANIATQDVCPLSLADHMTLGSSDAVGYALAMDAFRNAGPASPARIKQSACLQPFHEGINPVTFPLDVAGYATSTATGIAGYPMSAAEPPLKSYVFAG